MEDRKLPQTVIDKARSDIVGAVGKFLKLQQHGTEYICLCPFHKEKTPSFQVIPEKGFFYCQGCGEGGDAVDFVRKLTGCSFREAIEKITGDLPHDYVAPVQRASVKKADEWVPVTPVPAGAGVPPDVFNRPKGGEFQKITASMRWAYRDADGQVLGYTCRFELPEGGKDVIPQTYCVNTTTGEERWKWGSFAKPRPMYGLEKLARHPNAQVMMVEGEKTADRAQDLFKANGVPMDAVVTLAWPGGAKAIKYIDWSPLAGRKIGLWPDADLKDYAENHPLAGQRMPFLHQPGTSGMMAIYDAIADSAAVVKFIVPPTDVEDGWDLADAGADFPLIAHLKANSILASEVRERFAVADDEPEPEPPLPEPPSDDTPPWEGEYEPAPTYEAETPAPEETASYDADEFDDSLVANGNFTILGYDQDDYYFFHHEKGQVLSRTSGNFSETGLTELAPTQWWEANFPGGSGQCKFNKMQAINWIFRTANARGIYDPTRVRGRGAWTDKSRAVYHLGKSLVVDGKHCDITRIESAFVYPMSRGILEPTLVPMSDDEGGHLCDVAAMARWTSPGSAALVAGWVMLAPVCGALNWRPHVWFTGGAGSGKTTLQKLFCGSLTRGVHVYANGNSTEAGIRQELKADALPVLVDEFESNNDREKQRVENVMSLIRQTSSETQARTLKGTVSGDSQHYQIRSMFCLASINTNLPTKADVDRITVLGLKASVPGQVDNWPALEAELNKIDMDPDISSRLLSRALQMMPVILETVKLFRRISANHFGRQRDADQYGTLLAGYWCLQKSYVPSEQEAMVVIKGFDWKEHMEDHDKDDAAKTLDSLLGAKIRMKDGEFSVYELIRATSTYRQQIDPLHDVAQATLARHGIRVEHGLDQLWFGVTTPEIVKLVRDMSSSTGLRGQLLRLDGAKKVEPKKYAGVLSRGVSIPLAPILADEVDGPGELPI